MIDSWLFNVQQQIQFVIFDQPVCAVLFYKILAKTGKFFTVPTAYQDEVDKSQLWLKLVFKKCLHYTLASEVILSVGMDKDFWSQKFISAISPPDLKKKMLLL